MFDEHTRSAHGEQANFSCLAPAFIAVTQMWYRRREQPLRLGAWYAMNGVTNMVGRTISLDITHRIRF